MSTGPYNVLLELGRHTYDLFDRLVVAEERKASALERIATAHEGRPAAGAKPAPVGAPTPGAAGAADAMLTIRFGKNKGALVESLETKQIRAAAHYVAESWFQKDQYADANLAYLAALNAHLAARGSPRIDAEPKPAAAPAAPEEPPPERGAPSQDDIKF